MARAAQDRVRPLAAAPLARPGRARAAAGAGRGGGPDARRPQRLGAPDLSLAPAPRARRRAGDALRAGRALHRPLRRPAGQRSDRGQLPAGRARRPPADAARGSAGGADAAARERRQQPLRSQLAAAGPALARAEARGARVERVGFVGRERNLAPAFRSAQFRRELAQRGFTLVLRERPWWDYRDLDAILAVRDASPAKLRTKPASKLVNAWHAGCPALLGPEPAFEARRRSPLDFLVGRHAGGRARGAAPPARGARPLRGDGRERPAAARASSASSGSPSAGRTCSPGRWRRTSSAGAAPPAARAGCASRCAPRSRGCAAIATATTRTSTTPASGKRGHDAARPLGLRDREGRGGSHQGLPRFARLLRRDRGGRRALARRDARDRRGAGRPRDRARLARPRGAEGVRDPRRAPRLGALRRRRRAHLPRAGVGDPAPAARRAFRGRPAGGCRASPGISGARSATAPGTRTRSSASSTAAAAAGRGAIRTTASSSTASRAVCADTCSITRTGTSRTISRPSTATPPRWPAGWPSRAGAPG